MTKKPRIALSGHDHRALSTELDQGRQISAATDGLKIAWLLSNQLVVGDLTWMPFDF
jgi:hypothetical protein